MLLPSRRSRRDAGGARRRALAPRRGTFARGRDAASPRRLLLVRDPSGAAPGTARTPCASSSSRSAGRMHLATRAGIRRDENDNANPSEISTAAPSAGPYSGPWRMRSRRRRPRSTRAGSRGSAGRARGQRHDLAAPRSGPGARSIARTSSAGSGSSSSGARTLGSSSVAEVVAAPAGSRGGRGGTGRRRCAARTRRRPTARPARSAARRVRRSPRPTAAVSRRADHEPSQGARRRGERLGAIRVLRLAEDRDQHVPARPGQHPAERVGLGRRARRPGPSSGSVCGSA